MLEQAETVLVVARAPPHQEQPVLLGEPCEGTLDKDLRQIVMRSVMALLLLLRRTVVDTAVIDCFRCAAAAAAVTRCGQDCNRGGPGAAHRGW